MSISNDFLKYVELQRNANAIREEHGANHPKTTEAYDKANVQKRLVLNAIEELEFRIESLEK